MYEPLRHHAPGQRTLTATRNGWERIRAWVVIATATPGNLRVRGERPIQVSTGTELAEPCDFYCKNSKNKTIEEYRRILFDDALAILNGDLPVVHFPWEYKHLMVIRTTPQPCSGGMSALSFRVAVTTDKLPLAVEGTDDAQKYTDAQLWIGESSLFNQEGFN